MSTPVAFRHLGVRAGFEVAWFTPPTLLRGGSTFVELGDGHHIAYEITLAPDGSTSAATVRSLDRVVALTRGSFSGPFVDGEQAVLTLAVYLAAFLAGSAWLLRRRDVA